jgi:hypothetical protein
MTGMCNLVLTLTTEYGLWVWRGDEMRGRMSVCALLQCCFTLTLLSTSACSSLFSHTVHLMSRGLMWCRWRGEERQAAL